MTEHAAPLSCDGTSLTLLKRLTSEPNTLDWHRLVAIYVPLLSSWCNRLGVAYQDRDDLVQETLIVMIRGLACFEHRGHGSFRGWVRTILTNHLRNHARKRSPLLRSDWSQLDDANSELSQRFNFEHDLHIASLAMERVKICCTPMAWRAFELLMLQHLPLQEVALATGLTTNAVLKTRARVLRRIRVEIEALTSF